jgi:hypothetical protein
MALFFFLVSSGWLNTHPIVVFVTVRYSIKSLLDIKGMSIDKLCRYYLILLKASSHSSFQVPGFFFLGTGR